MSRWITCSSEVLGGVYYLLQDNRILGDHELVSNVMSAWVFMFKDSVEYLSSVHKKKKKRRLSMFTNASPQSVVKNGCVGGGFIQI